MCGAAGCPELAGPPADGGPVVQGATGPLCNRAGSGIVWRKGDQEDARAEPRHAVDEEEPSALPSRCEPGPLVNDAGRAGFVECALVAGIYW